jgi:hypothetical protein
MAQLTIRSIKGAPLTSNELDDNFTYLESVKLDTVSFTAADVLSKLKTVDGAGSGLDADTLDGKQATDFVQHTEGAVSGDLSVTGSLSHQGLTLTAGTQVDQLYTLAPSLTLTTEWQEVGLTGAALPTGSYMLQLFVDDHSVGGGHQATYYHGTLGWFDADTLDTGSSEVPLHKTGRTDGGNDVFLRTRRRTGGSGGAVLEISASYVATGLSTYTIKLRRMI